MIFWWLMSQPLSSDMRRALADRIRYYQEMGIYDFYRRPARVDPASEALAPVADLSLL